MADAEYGTELYEAQRHVEVLRWALNDRHIADYTVVELYDSFLELAKAEAELKKLEEEQ